MAMSARDASATRFGAVDSNVTYLPEALRQRAAKMEIEQPPTSILVVRDHISEVFTTASSPNNIGVFSPIPAKYGGWNVCIRASVNGPTGRSIGMQTYLMNIEHKSDRRAGARRCRPLVR